MQVAKGPQRSQWINSKGAEDTWLLMEKGSLFYLEKWQTSQHEALLETSMFATFFNNWSLENERWPNIVCHKSVLERGLVAVRAEDLC